MPGIDWGGLRGDVINQQSIHISSCIEGSLLTSSALLVASIVQVTLVLQGRLYVWVCWRSDLVR
jgi:hypothetical protein